jgi:hypothetical protein
MGNVFHDCLPKKHIQSSIERPHLVDLAPDEIILKKDAPTTPFSVMNTTSHWLAFKVQFSIPDKYYVKPVQDIIGPQGTKVCEVGLLLKKTATATANNNATNNNPPSTTATMNPTTLTSEQDLPPEEADKIRVKSVQVEMDFVTKIENLREFGTKEDINKAFRELFESKDKQLVSSDFATVRIVTKPATTTTTTSSENGENKS